MAACGGKGTGGLIDVNLPTTCADHSVVVTVLNITFAIIGAIALLIVVIGGFRYIRAGSNETIVAESKRQIAHALVGLIVAISASAIVNFVMGRWL